MMSLNNDNIKWYLLKLLKMGQNVVMVKKKGGANRFCVDY